MVPPFTNLIFLSHHDKCKCTWRPVSRESILFIKLNLSSCLCLMEIENLQKASSMPPSPNKIGLGPRSTICRYSPKRLMYGLLSTSKSNATTSNGLFLLVLLRFIDSWMTFWYWAHPLRSFSTLLHCCQMQKIQNCCCLRWHWIKSICQNFRWGCRQHQHSTPKSIALPTHPGHYTMTIFLCILNVITAACVKFNVVIESLWPTRGQEISLVVP